MWRHQAGKRIGRQVGALERYQNKPLTKIEVVTWSLGISSRSKRLSAIDIIRSPANMKFSMIALGLSLFASNAFASAAVSYSCVWSRMRRKSAIRQFFSDVFPIRLLMPATRTSRLPFCRLAETTSTNRSYCRCSAPTPKNECQQDSSGEIYLNSANFRMDPTQTGNALLLMSCRSSRPARVKTRV